MIVFKLEWFYLNWDDSGRTGMIQIKVGGFYLLVGMILTKLGSVYLTGMSLFKGG